MESFELIQSIALNKIGHFVPVNQQREEAIKFWHLPRDFEYATINNVADAKKEAAYYFHNYETVNCFQFSNGNWLATCTSKSSLRKAPHTCSSGFQLLKELACSKLLSCVKEVIHKSWR